jgi:hypothetical protein
MTASARFSTEGGIIRPIAFAEPALITSSKVMAVNRQVGRPGPLENPVHVLRLVARKKKILIP